MHKETVSQEVENAFCTYVAACAQQACLPIFKRSHLVAMKERARLMKLPRLASSSELFLAVKSDHLKSVSDVSGLLLSKKYLQTCSTSQDGVVPKHHPRVGPKAPS